MALFPGVYSVSDHGDICYALRVCLYCMITEVEFLWNMSIHHGFRLGRATDKCERGIPFDSVDERTDGEGQALWQLDREIRISCSESCERWRKGRINCDASRWQSSASFSLSCAGFCQQRHKLRFLQEIRGARTFDLVPQSKANVEGI